MAENRSSIAVIDLGCQAGSHIAFRRIGKYSLLEWIVRNLSGSALLDTVVVTGSPVYTSAMDAEGLSTVAWCPSESSTGLGRTMDAVNATDAKWIVLVQENSPFVDPVLIDRLIAAAWATPHSDLISFASAIRPASSTLSSGLIAEICSRRSLRKLCLTTSVSEDYRPVGRLLHSMPELFQPRYLPLPLALDRVGVRWTLETEEDWERARLLLDSSSADRDYRELADLAVHCDHNRLR
jgi:spore coat polysaccharide biosynthesis protein SpsF (cytidylyltransferase family)